jgi:hypothetical protein
VPPADWFGVFNREDFADDLFLSDEVAEEHIVGTIAEDMADGEDSLGGLGGQHPLDAEAVLESRREGFLAHDVEVQGCEGEEDVDVLTIRHTDEDRIDAAILSFIFLIFFERTIFLLLPSLRLCCDEILPRGVFCTRFRVGSTPDVFPAKCTSLGSVGFRDGSHLR